MTSLTTTDPPTAAARLLVSIREVSEVEPALQGGADIIDIKNPDRGPLGRADFHVIEKILQAVASRAPVSAALGELVDLADAVQIPSGLAYLKVGLARAPSDWESQLARCLAMGVPLVAVGYVDHSRCGAPSPRDVAQWAVDHHAAGLLLDTAIKDGRGLRQWQTKSQLHGLAKLMREHDLLFALAGSLKVSDLAELSVIGADVLGVRGAACERGQRQDRISLARVTELKAAIGSPPDRVT